jgi:hypothetical protein
MSVNVKLVAEAIPAEHNSIIVGIAVDYVDIEEVVGASHSSEPHLRRITKDSHLALR